MNTLELKQKIIDKLKFVDDVDLLKQIINLLQPVDPNEIKHLNENELETPRETEDEIKSGSDGYHKQLDKEDSEWLTEL
jgi:hypothetical protein